MFKSKTLFVLGAGASHEVEMPLGDKLLTQISEALNFEFDEFGYRKGSGRKDIEKAFLEHTLTTSNGLDRDTRPYIEAALTISKVAQIERSIDRLLDKRQDEKVSFCGKLAIADCILKAERKSSLYTGSLYEGNLKQLNYGVLNNTWLSPFLEMLTDEITCKNLESIFNNISFISFNYDRCLKQFLIQVLHDLYGIPVKDIQNLLKKLKVIFPYGSIAPLDFEANDGLEFGAQVNSTRLLEIANRLKTFTEQNKDDQITMDIANEVNKANKIVFLGFAYHPQNLNILSKRYEKVKIFGTTFGISKSNTEQIQSEIANKVFNLPIPTKTVSQERVFLRDLKCYDFLNEFSRSLTL